MRAVVLLSGGLDSYTAAAIAQARGLHAVRADDRTTASGTRARSRRRARSRARSASSGTSSSTSTCAASAARRSPRTPPCRATAISSAPGIPSTYVPARNTIFLSLALGWAEVARRARHRHRRQRARLLRLSRLPAGVHRARSSALARPRDARRRRGRAVPRAHAADRAEQGRHHPARPRARPRLRPDAQLLRSVADGTPVRAAATAACCAPKDFAKPASPIPCSCARIRREIAAHSRRPAHPPSGRVAITCALLVPFAIAAVWSATARASSMRTSCASRPASVAATAGAYLDQYLTGLDSMASRARAPSGRDRARSRRKPIRCSRQCCAISRCSSTSSCTDRRRRPRRAAAFRAHRLTARADARPRQSGRCSTGKPVVSELVTGAVSRQADGRARLSGARRRRRDRRRPRHSASTCSGSRRCSRAFRCRTDRSSR